MALALALASASASALASVTGTHGIGIGIGTKRPTMILAHLNSFMTMTRRRPVFLFDVMGTIVRDPFYEDVPAFFGLSMKELLQVKNPIAWIEFEKGMINEEELALKYFTDGRTFNLDGLKHCMSNGYAYLEGMESLLCRLKSDGYEMHAFTNYPCWYMMIEQKLKLSTYLYWTFCSCHTKKQKPDAEAYVEVIKHLKIPSSSCIFIDDRVVNIEGALKLGMDAILFENARKLEQDFLSLGIEVSRSKQ